VNLPRRLPTAAAAAALGVHPKTLWRWHKKGLVEPAHVTAGGQARWDVEDLKVQLTSQSTLVPEPDDENGKRPIVAAIVTSPMGVLCSWRNDKEPPVGFITGEIEPGESAADAVVREVKEETQLEVVAAQRDIARRPHPIYPRFVIYVACQPVGELDVHVGDEEELADVRWLPLVQLEELMPTMFEPIRMYLRRSLLT
jgi:8-oxo-dGTP pyrophosphatase MutT (NUDIX family)